MKGWAIVAALALAAMLFAAWDRGGEPFTLYRDSVAIPNARIHVASFDASDPGSYNQENCAQAATLFQAQDGVKTKFWCEKGRFRP